MKKKIFNIKVKLCNLHGYIYFNFYKFESSSFCTHNSFHQNNQVSFFVTVKGTINPKKNFMT